MNSMTSTGIKISSAIAITLQERMQVVPVPGARVLPQTQAGFAPWSGPALCRDASRTSAATEESANGAESSEVETSSIACEAENRDGHKKISTGVRSVNRLLLSLWFLLLPLIWPSSDWIGLIILSQAFFVAANLIRAPRSAPAATLNECAVLNINDGDGSGKG